MIPSIKPPSARIASIGADARSLPEELREQAAALVNPLLGLALAMLAWEAAIFAALLFDSVGLVTYIVVHIGSCLIAGYAVLRNALVSGPLRDGALQLLAWSAFAGPFGALVGASLAVGGALPRIHAHPGEEEACIEIDDVERLHNALLDKRVRLDSARHIRPLIDLIVEGTQPEKLEALSIVYKHYDAAFGAVLKLALEDPEASVRVLAATVMAKLHSTYTRNIGDHQAAAGAHPDAPQRWRNLALSRLKYADSGLLETSRACTEIESAIEDLTRASKIDAGDSDTRHLLEKARMQLAARRGDVHQSGSTRIGVTVP